MGPIPFPSSSHREDPVHLLADLAPEVEVAEAGVMLRLAFLALLPEPLGPAGGTVDVTGLDAAGAPPCNGQGQPSTIDEGPFEQLARLPVRFFVAQLHRQQLGGSSLA